MLFNGWGDGGVGPVQLVDWSSFVDCSWCKSTSTYDFGLQCGVPLTSVNVLPLAIWPYAKMTKLYPSMAAHT